MSKNDDGYFSSRKWKYLRSQVCRGQGHLWWIQVLKKKKRSGGGGGGFTYIFKIDAFRPVPNFSEKNGRDTWPKKSNFSGKKGGAHAHKSLN